ncbi:MAG: O-antigen ligase family protein [Acidobacteriia bacterium]|nr:O-antigen ligase family protein [Terriglobia bacterium]
MSRTRPAPASGPPTARVLAALSFLAAVALVLVVPLVFDSRALEVFRGPKRELALAAWSVLAAVFTVANLGGASWRDRWWPAWGGVIAGGTLSALACPAPARALVDVLPIVLAALGWGALRQLSEKRRRSLLRLVVWAGAIEAGLVLLFLVPSWQPQAFSLLLLSGRYGWIGTFGNPGEVAVFLALPALVAAEHALERRHRRPVWAGAAVLMAGVLLGTGTLSGVLALAVGVSALAWRRVKPARRIPVVAAVLAVAVVVFVATPLARRVTAAVGEARRGGLIWLGSARGAAYVAAGSMLAARPTTGVGFGLFEANSFRFQSLDALAERGRVLGMVTGFGEAHCEPLQYTAETGGLGLLLAAAGAVLVWRRKGPPARGIVDALPIAAAATVLALTQFPLHLAAVAAQWVVLAALAVPPLPPPPDPTGWSGRLRLLAIGILVGIAITVTWQRYRATIAFRQAKVLVESLRSSPMRPSAKTELTRTALANLRRPLRWLPNSWEAALTMGNVAAQAGETRAALDSFGRALALADRPEVRFDLGIALLMAGDREEGMSQLLRAVELNPAVFREIKDPDLSRSLRGRLDASGYGARNAWMYKGTPAEQP